MNIHTNLILLETRIIDLHFATDSQIFLVGSVKLFHFYRSDVSAVQRYPRSLILVIIVSM